MLPLTIMKDIAVMMFVILKMVMQMKAILCQQEVEELPGT